MKNKCKFISKYIVGMFFVVLIGTLFLLKNVGNISGENNQEQKINYKQHYALIVDKDDKYKDFYEGIKTAADLKKIYVENFRESFGNYMSTEELVDIAIDSKVDGIIVEATADINLEEKINKSSESNIPVVTVWGDASNSKRKSYIGLNGTNLGEIYGEYINSQGVAEDSSVLVLSNNTDTFIDMLYSNMIKTISGTPDIKICSNNAELFETEEILNNEIRNSNVDTIICLNSKDTQIAAQILIENNLVGKVHIIGFYQDEENINLIKKDIINCVIGIDAKNVGEKAVEMLFKSRTDKYINEYEYISPYIIDKNNLKEIDDET